MKMEEFKSKFTNQNILCIKSWNGYVLAGCGGYLLLYENETICNSISIFGHHKIHKIVVSGFCNSTIVLLAGKNVAVLRFNKEKVTNMLTVKCEDWILDGLFIDDSTITLITAHNKAQLWKYSTHLSLKTCSSCQERCILYSSTLYLADKELLVFAGTVYSEIILWKPNFENPTEIPVILHRLTGHKGVIFSITVKDFADDLHMISTTSDDRSIRLWSVKGNWDDALISDAPALFGHTARVWKSVILSNLVVSVGEDSFLIFWKLDGTLVNKVLLHQGGGVRALEFLEDDQYFITGGSDGGICKYSVPQLLKPGNIVTLSNESMRFDNKEIPRKVKFLQKTHAIWLTNNGRILSQDFGVVAENEIMRLSTDLEVSDCKRYAAVCTIKGRLLIYDVESKDNLVTDYYLGENKMCHSLRWRGPYMIVNVNDGKVVVFKVGENLELSEIGSYVLPKSRERLSTCHLCLGQVGEDDWLLLLGDRVGGLHVYQSSSENPRQTLRKLHSHLGIFDIFLNRERNTILTAGSGGWIRELMLVKNELVVLRSYSISLETATRFVNTTTGIYILGFLGADFKVWDLRNRTYLASFNCGGNHRSWDFHITEEYLNFVFIKNKLVNLTTFYLNQAIPVRHGYHFKTINCLQHLHENIIVSGGEDNTVRVAALHGGDIMPLTVLENHISSVRALSVCKIAENERIIVSAGGREQLSLTKFSIADGKCQELITNFTSGSQAEGRYMCLETLVRDNGNIVILVGCSDCTLRIFTFSEGALKLLIALNYTRCILHVAVLQSVPDIYAGAFSTDGSLVLWNLSQVLSNNSCQQSQRIQLHVSGINSYQLRCEEDNRFLLATGGDDNALRLTLLGYDSNNNNNNWSQTASWSSACVHGAQITGLVLANDLLFSIGLDQILVVHRIKILKESIESELLTTMMVSLPDIHGLISICSPCDHSLCIYGEGIELVNFGANELCNKELKKNPNSIKR